MPELPEVETTRRGLLPHLAQRRITGVVLRRPDLRWPIPPGGCGAAAGGNHPRRPPAREIPAARHRPRQRGPAPGHVGHVAGAAGGDPVAAHDHVDLALDSGRVLRFTDPRRFGCLLWQPAGETHDLLRDLGPEPLSDAFDGDLLYERSRRRRAPVKTFLMDQAIVVGVGNIYAAESLFRAGIAPTRDAGSIGRARYGRLAAAVKDILAMAITRGGTTLRDFLNADGAPGYFEQELFVYGREGQPCKVCGRRLRESRLGNRAGAWCGRCQT